MRATNEIDYDNLRHDGMRGAQYNKLRMTGKTPDEAAMAVYGVPADSALAALGSQLAPPEAVERVPDRVIEAGVLAEQEAGLGHDVPMERLASEIPPRGDEMPRLPEDPPVEQAPFPERVDRARARYGSIRALTEDLREAWAEAMGGYAQDMIGASNKASASSSEQADFDKMSSRFSAWLAGDSHKVIDTLMGTGWPLVGVVMAGWSWQAGDNSMILPRLHPSFMERDKEGVTNEKAFASKWAMTVGRGLHGFLTGNLAAMGTAHLEMREFGGIVGDFLNEGGLITHQDLHEAQKAGFGPFGHPQEGQQVVGGRRWDTKRFSSDPIERAREWKEVRDQAGEEYAGLLEHQGQVAGTIMIGSIALGNGIGEIVNDPLMFTTGVPKAAISGLRSMRLARNPLQTTRILGRIAQRTNNLADIANYINAARKAALDTAAKAHKYPTEVNKRKAAQAKVLLLEAEGQLRAKKVSPHDAIVTAGAEETGAMLLPSSRKLGDTVEELAEEVTSPPKPTQLRTNSQIHAPKNVFEEDPLNFRYSDIIEVFGIDDDPALRRHALMVGVRRNIMQGAREMLSETTLRLWEDVYQALKNMDPNDVPEYVSKLWGTPADKAINMDDVSRIAFINRHGDTVFQSRVLSEAEAQARLWGGPTSAEYNAVAAQGALAGVPLEQLQMRYSSVSDFMAATTERLVAVTDDGLINHAALDEYRRAVTKQANKMRTARLAELETIGQPDIYDLTESGELFRLGHRAHLSGIDPKIRFMPKDEKAARVAALKAYKELKAQGAGETVPFDYGLYGRAPEDKSPIPADWNRTRGEKISDTLTRGLYPETWVPTVTEELRRLFYFPREAGRAINAVYPRMWSRIQNALHARDFERTRMVSVFADALLESGAYVPDMSLTSGGGVLPKRLPNGAVKIKNKELNDAMFDVLDTPEKVIDANGNVVHNPDFFNLMDALPPEAQTAVRRIRQIMDHYARKQGLAETDMYISAYISHIFNGAQGQEILREISSDPNLVLTIRHLMDRTGQLQPDQFMKNLATIGDVYASAMSRKMHMEPLYFDLQEMVLAAQRNKLGTSVDSPTGERVPRTVDNLTDDWLAGEVNRITRILKNEPSQAGQVVDGMVGAINRGLRTMTPLEHLPGLGDGRRATAVKSWAPGGKIPEYRPGDAGRALMVLTNTSYAGLLSGNPRYLPMQLATGIATNAAEYGLGSTLFGAAAMTSPETQLLARAAGIHQHHAQIYGSTSFRKLVDIASSWHPGTPSINMSEFYVRGITMHASIDDVLRRMGYAQLSHAIEDGFGPSILQHAIRSSQEVNHLFGILGKPTHLSRLSRSMGVAATQFLSFLPKQTEQLLAMTLKNPGSFFEYMAVSGLIQRVAVMELGIDMSQYVGMGFRPSGDVTDPVESASMQTLLAAAKWGGLMAGRALQFRVTDMDVDRATEELGMALEKNVPYAVGYQARFAGFSAAVNAFAEDGAEPSVKRDSRGGQVRELDLDWRNIGILSDLPARVTGMRSVQDALDTEANDRLRDIKDAKAYRQYTLTRSWLRADGQNDHAKKAEIWAEMVDEGMVPGQDIASPNYLANSFMQGAIVNMVDRNVREVLLTPGMRLRGIEALEDIEDFRDAMGPED